MENKRFEITETAGSVKGFYVVVDKETGVNYLVAKFGAGAGICQREFDLVLLDINLPDGNGFELCKLIKPQHPDTIVIFLTANDQESNQIQGANAIVDAMSATIMKRHNPGLTDPQLRQLITAHIDEDSFCRYVIQQDINKIALDLREAHRDDFFSVPEDNPLKGLLQAADEVAREDSDPEQASLAFICKRLRLNYKKLSEEEKKWLKKISEKSDLLKNPNPQRGKRG